MSQPLLDWLTLALTPGVGPNSFLKLIDIFGSTRAALGANSSQLGGVLTKNAAQALQNGEGISSAKAALKWAEQDGCSLLTLLDDDYPVELAEAGAAVPVLFARGNRQLLQRPKLAMVGSRNATPQGQKTARDFAAGLAEHGYTIVSGMASGIDTSAHEGAVDSPSSTIAIIGTGIDRVYPASNRKLAHQLAEQGLILSEFALGIGPLAQNFPRRNRVIAGLSKGCLVVEANVNSGSLITARLAAEFGREVLAIPGSIHNAQARGCHKLIKDGAKLVETVDDVLDEVGRLTHSDRAETPSGAQHSLAGLTNSVTTSLSELILQTMDFDPIRTDTLAQRLGQPLDTGELYSTLLELELSGHVSSLPGDRYQKLG